MVPLQFPAADLDGDGVVNQNELNSIVSNYWAKSPWLYITNMARLNHTNPSFALTMRWPRCK